MKKVLEGYKPIIEYSKKLFSIKSYLTSDENEYYKLVNANSNIYRMLAMISITFLFQLVNLISGNITFYYRTYNIELNLFSLFLIFICAIYFVIISVMISDSNKTYSLSIQKLIINSFWLLISVGSLLFNVLDLIKSRSLSNFTLLLAATAIVPVLPLKERVFLFLFDIIFQIAVIIIIGAETYLIHHCILLIIGALLVSQALFSSHVVSKLSERKLKIISQTDALTNLPNRRGMEEWINEKKNEFIVHNCNIAFGIIDIDFFKKYNDEYGHLAGDECLKTIAGCLKSFFNDRLSFVCRFGGEEFIVMLLNVSEKEALKKFVDIKSIIENIKISLSCEKQLTISVGVAFSFFNENTDINEVFQNADKALYKAKGSGRNLVATDDGRYFS